MKINLACWHFHGYAGSQSWAYTLAKVFREMGHEVVFYCQAFGKMGMRLIGEGFVVKSHVDGAPKADLHIISQPHTFMLCGRCGQMDVVDHTTPDGKECKAGKTRNLLPRDGERRIYICHGWLPQDAPMTDGTPYFTVSPEMQKKLKKKADIDATVIPQPIDMEVFKPTSHRKEHKGKVVALSTWPASREVVEKAVKGIGAELLETPTRGQVWDVASWINKGATVIGTGRGIAEAMACGRMPVICGGFGCDGVVTATDIEKQAEVNFSGRWQAMEPAAALGGHLMPVMHTSAEWWREEALRRFDPMKVAEALLAEEA